MLIKTYREQEILINALKRERFLCQDDFDHLESGRDEAIEALRKEIDVILKRLQKIYGLC